MTLTDEMVVNNQKGHRMIFPWSVFWCDSSTCQEL